jgi:hypothetical protein
LRIVVAVDADATTIVSNGLVKKLCFAKIVAVFEVAEAECVFELLRK